MGSRYLTDLANVVRGAGLVVEEEPGWQTRARGSGGYDSGRPDHLMVHHTASGPGSDGQSDVDYMVYGSENRPIANLYLSRTGKVWVMAAGATNTNGSGRCPHCGTTDNMNSRALGIEAANDGVGEPWPAVQQDAYDRLCSTLLPHYGIPSAACRAHFEYAPDRKVDPAGPSRWSPHPTGGGGANEWLMDRFRSDVSGGAPPGPGPGPPPGTKGDDVALCIQAPDGTSEQRFATFAYQPGIAIGWITSQTQIDVGRATGTLIFHGETGETLKNFKVAEIQAIIDQCWVGGDKPPGYH